MSIVSASEITLAAIRAAQAGDARARERVARTLVQNSVFRIREAARFLADTDEAQSAFGIAVARAIAEFRPDGGTFHGFALNCYNDIVCNVKKTRARITRADAEFAAVAPTYFLIATDHRESSHDISRMRSVATTLPLRQRAAYAALAAGKSTADIARQLKISRQAAHRLKQRVISNLRVALNARTAA